MEDFHSPLIIEEQYACSPSELWEAITDPAQMRLWFFPQIKDFKAEVGFDTLFDVETGGRVFPHHWTITEVVPLERIVYLWRYTGYAGEGRIIFDLMDAGDQTRLRMTQYGQESFDQNIPEFRRESAIEGWTYLLKQSLKQHIENKA